MKLLVFSLVFIFSINTLALEPVEQLVEAQVCEVIDSYHQNSMKSNQCVDKDSRNNCIASKSPPTINTKCSLDLINDARAVFNYDYRSSSHDYKTQFGYYSYGNVTCLFAADNLQEWECFHEKYLNFKSANAFYEVIRYNFIHKIPDIINSHI